MADNGFAKLKTLLFGGGQQPNAPEGILNTLLSEGVGRSFDNNNDMKDRMQMQQVQQHPDMSPGNYVPQIAAPYEDTKFGPAPRSGGLQNLRRKVGQ